MPVEENTKEKQPYKFPDSIITRAKEIQDWCEKNRPEIHMIIAFAHDDGTHIDLDVYRCGSLHIMSQMIEETARELHRLTLKSILEGIQERLK